jgi:(E)-4-hydroxy-3-methylbut-2-enyl-diphosphate synthase
MTNIPIDDIDANIASIHSLHNAGAELVRLAVKDERAVESFGIIKKHVDIPLCADIHFDYKLAIASIKKGADKIRINPGNIKSQDKIKEIIKTAKDYQTPIRIGVNGGSIDREKYNHPAPKTLVESAAEHIKLFEDNNFTDIIVSIKTSDLNDTIQANILFSEKYDYPVHIGLTEAGFGNSCIVQSSIAIGALLYNGIGDTIRVSMTGDPILEVKLGQEILKSMGLLERGIKIISCPTCGRTDPRFNVLKVAEEVKAKCDELLISKPLKLAVMGCEVNGPGEAADADYGLAGGHDGFVMLFAKGKKIRKVSIDEAVNALMQTLSAD